MSENVLVFPHQLFRDHPQIEEGSKVFLIEAERFFTEFSFHKQKLVFHRASMQYYRNMLEEQGIDVEYLEFDEDPLETVFERIGFGSKIKHLDTVDHNLREKLETLSEDSDVEIVREETPGFLTSVENFRSFFEDQEGYHMTSFYRHQRKKLDILVKDGDPEGGKWSFDPENRKKLPKEQEPPELPDVDHGILVEEAIEYVEENFKDNPGKTKRFVYPVRHDTTEIWLENFLEKKLEKFGDHQDAMEPDKTFLYHSVISPMLNTGLITPDKVVERTLERYREDGVPLNSVEGFLRQIIGWREFVRGVYEMEGEKQRAANYWDNKRELPEGFYTAETGLRPVDRAVKRIEDTGYAHHIERLMVLGNIMLLMEIEPDQVYRWFMEMFIDSYDWVMVPNVYGMSQYSDGGDIVTKPYISSSNYIDKMSHFEGGEWEEIWDGLYWRFIEKYRDKIADNPRMGMMVSLLDRMNEETIADHISTAEDFLSEIF